MAWQVSAPVIQGGAHIIVAQTVYGHKTTRKSNPYMLVNAKLPTGFRSVIEPKLMYNAGSGEWNIFRVLFLPIFRSFSLFFLKNELFPFVSGETIFERPTGKLALPTSSRHFTNFLRKGGNFTKYFKRGFGIIRLIQTLISF